MSTPRTPVLLMLRPLLTGSVYPHDMKRGVNWMIIVMTLQVLPARIYACSSTLSETIIIVI